MAALETETCSTLRGAAEAVRKAEAGLYKARATVTKIERQRADGVRSNAELEGRIKDAAVNAMLADEGMPAADPALTEGLRHAAAQIAGADHARPVAVAHVEKAERVLALARASLTGAELQWIAEVRETTRLEVVAKLAALAPALARLRAVDAVQESLAGEPFATKDANIPRPWSGKVASDLLIAGLVDRLRPAALDKAEIAKLTTVETATLALALKETQT